MRHTKLLVVGFAVWAGSAAAQPHKYTGPGGCAAVSCHGGVQTRSETAVLQNEYSVWVVKDKHSRAYEALSMPIAIRMAEILEPFAFDAVYGSFSGRGQIDANGKQVVAASVARYIARISET